MPGVTLRNEEMSSEIVENRKRLFIIILIFEVMTTGLHSLGWCVSFLALPEQNPINLVA